MPSSTSLGITFPCGLDAINCADFASNALSIEAALAAVDTKSLKATRRPAVTVTATSSPYATYTPGTPLILTWGAVWYDTDNMFTFAAPTILTVKTAGLYMISARVDPNTISTTTSVKVEILLNGATTLAQAKMGPGIAGSGPHNNVNAAIIAPLSVGNTLANRLTVTGGAADIATGNLSCALLSYGGF